MRAGSRCEFASGSPHKPLFFFSGLKRCEHRVRYSQLFPLMTSGPSERRIHYHEVEMRVRQRRPNLLFAGTHSLGGLGRNRHDVELPLRIEQVERTKRDSAVWLLAIGDSK